MSIQTLPDFIEIRARMAGMNYASMNKLAAESGVSFNTIIKIRDGNYSDVKLGTARAIWPHLPPIAIKSAA